MGFFNKARIDYYNKSTSFTLLRTMSTAFLTSFPQSKLYFLFKIALMYFDYLNKKITSGINMLSVN